MSANEVRILRAALAKHRRSLYTLQLQAADYAASQVPLHLLNHIRDAERVISDTEDRLRTLGDDPSTVSEADISLPDVGVTVRRVPFMASRLERFVERPAEFEAIKDALLANQAGQQVAISTAIRGAGGFGKTTLAIMVCHDPEVKATFSDGILWVTLGEQPDVIGALGVLYRGLTATKPDFLNLEDATQQLAVVLANTRCLIVLDDVWQASSLAPFQYIATPSTWLITTRILDIALQFQAVKVDEMTSAESVELLTLRLPTPLADLVPFHRLAQRLGEWPLLLNLAGAYLAEQVMTFGKPLDQAVAALDARYTKVGMVAFNRQNDQARNAAADRSLGVSLDLLTDDLHQHLVKLAIFPEDTAIPLVTAARLWGCNALDAEDLALYYARLSLLQVDLASGTMRLHDVVLDYLLRQLKDCTDVHRRFLGTYDIDGVLVFPPNDFYIKVRFLWHLVHSGDDIDLWSKVDAENPEKKLMQEILIKESSYAQIATKLGVSPGRAHVR